MVESATILVVDDEPGIALLCQRILSRVGYDVMSLTDPREAIEYLQHNRLDLLLVDIRMPEIDGFDVISRAQRAQHRAFVAPLIARRLDCRKQYSDTRQQRESENVLNGERCFVHHGADLIQNRFEIDGHDLGKSTNESAQNGTLVLGDMNTGDERSCCVIQDPG